MDMNENVSPEVILLGGELAQIVPTARQRVFRKVVMAALGSIPWVGGVLTAAASFREESGQLKVDGLQRQWLEEHEQKMQRLAAALTEVVGRLNGFWQDVERRLESDAFLQLVHKAFRTWDSADTEEKRTLVKRILTNAGATKLCSDDVVRLFLDWVERYHEAHFSVIREVYKNPECTRAEIWQSIYGPSPRDDSAEADLFRLLIHDMSVGRVIRQVRQTTGDGHFLRKQAARRGPASPIMKSAFDNVERYELTELGKQFVHYCMEEVVPRVATGE